MNRISDNDLRDVIDYFTNDELINLIFLNKRWYRYSCIALAQSKAFKARESLVKDYCNEINYLNADAFVFDFTFPKLNNLFIQLDPQSIESGIAFLQKHNFITKLGLTFHADKNKTVSDADQAYFIYNTLPVLEKLNCLKLSCSGEAVALTIGLLRQNQLRMFYLTCEKLPKNFIKILYKRFPNLEQLSLDSNFGLAKEVTSSFIYKWPRLKELTIKSISQKEVGLNLHYRYFPTLTTFVCMSQYQPSFELVKIDREETWSTVTNIQLNALHSKCIDLIPSLFPDLSYLSCDLKESNQTNINELLKSLKQLISLDITILADDLFKLQTPINIKSFYIRDCSKNNSIHAISSIIYTMPKLSTLTIYVYAKWNWEYLDASTVCLEELLKLTIFRIDKTLDFLKWFIPLAPNLTLVALSLTEETEEIAKTFPKISFINMN